MTAGDAERLVLAVASVQAQHDHVLIALPAVPTAGHSHAILDWDKKPYWRDAEAWKRIPALSVAWTCRARRAMRISDLTSRVAANLDKPRLRKIINRVYFSRLLLAERAVLAANTPSLPSRVAPSTSAVLLHCPSFASIARHEVLVLYPLVAPGSWVKRAGPSSSAQSFSSPPARPPSLAFLHTWFCPRAILRPRLVRTSLSLQLCDWHLFLSSGHILLLLEFIVLKCPRSAADPVPRRGRIDNPPDRHEIDTLLHSPNPTRPRGNYSHFRKELTLHLLRHHCRLEAGIHSV